MTGLTQDAGWQVGARRTLPLPLEQAWDLVTGQPFLRRWCGLDALAADHPAVRSLTPLEVVRVRSKSSLVQMRLLPAVAGTTVAFHEDHLPDEGTRTRRKAHWGLVLDELEAASRHV